LTFWRLTEHSNNWDADRTEDQVRMQIENQVGAAGRDFSWCRISRGFGSVSSPGFITIMSFHLCTAEQRAIGRKENARSVLFLRLAAPHPLENGVKHRFQSRLEEGPGRKVNIPGASSGALMYDKTEQQRSELRGIQPGRSDLMKQSTRKKKHVESECHCADGAPCSRPGYPLI